MAQRRSRRNPSVELPRHAPIAQQQTEAASHPYSTHLPQVSDYESDTAGYTSDVPYKVPPRDRTNEQVNISVLKRHCPDVYEIRHHTPYAVVYAFTPVPEPTWNKIGIEGTLFINQLTPGPYGEARFNAMILNRRGLNNFIAPLTEGENAGVEITDEYVIISFKEGHELKIFGVFIFSEGPNSSTAQQREVTSEIMKSLATQAGESRVKAEAAASAAIAKHTNGHVQEAEETLDEQMGVPMGRQISLHQLFGQQRAEDAGFGVRAHNVDGGSEYPANTSQPMMPPSQPDVLGDLFRNAGIGLK
jgi:hypothetical protein